MSKTRAANTGVMAGMKPPQKRIRDVDTLRCFALLAVVALHNHLLPCGWIGVWLFYVVSGFVVTESLKNKEVKSRTEWLKAFFSKRIIRIFPLYFSYLALGVVCAVVTARYSDVVPIASLITFTNNVAMIFGVGEMQSWPVGHLWTISVEMQFYLCYGVAFVFLSRKNVVVCLATLLVVCPALRYIEGIGLYPILHTDLSTAYAVYATAFTHFDSFAAGALLSLKLTEIRRLKFEPILLLIGCVAMTMYVCAYVGVNALYLHRHGVGVFKNILSGVLYGQGREVFLYTALLSINVGVVAWTSRGDAPWGAITQIPLFQRIGEISYGAYILHLLCTHFAHYLVDFSPLRDHGATLLNLSIFVLAIPITIGAAEASFRFLESPISKRFSTRARR